jgi:hypothetical protein
MSNVRHLGRATKEDASMTTCYQGTIRINGAVECNLLDVFIGDYEIIVTGAEPQLSRRARLMLHPFDVQMFSRESNVAAMESGFFYSIRGTKVGAYVYGPLGNPADGENEYRPITEFTVRARFTRTDLTIEIDGKTEQGYGGSANSTGRQAPLHPWRFQVSFAVPREQMMSFLKIPQSTFKYFEARLNQCK